ncbi:glycoside hydrolase family 2 [bacterium]|nr:MAG: glycoside hydrolase family 2 [bacterium]
MKTIIMHIKPLPVVLFMASVACSMPGARAADTTNKSISLAGNWQFGLPTRNNASVLPRDLTQTIRLPGTMDDAGLGPKNERKPDLSGPYRLYDYAGPAWYRRDIDIPTNWSGKEVSLFLERCRWVTTAYLDGNKIGSQDSLIAPHIYSLGAHVSPGRHQLTICVDNTVKINLGGFVSALFGGTPGNMNGIIGRIELVAKPAVSLGDVQVYPNVDKMQARVVAKINNSTGQAGQGPIQIGNKTVPANWDADGGQVETVLDMKGSKLWDEFSPNLTEVTIRLGNDTKNLRFGMRKLAIKGTQFTMNGRPLLLRGTLECSVWPLTGYPPTDKDAWRRIYKLLKSYGLNFMRFHSWTPPEAAFAAADEEGFMLQPEAPDSQAVVGEDPRRDAFLEAESRRILDTYGNHPSFCLMAMGNEYGGDQKVLTKHVQFLIDHDPRHVYSSPTEWTMTENRQWTETTAGRGVRGPDTERDFGPTVTGDSRPVVGHEIGQWMYYPDMRTAKKYTGVMRLKNFDIIYDDLKRKGQINLAPKYLESSGKLATLLYKEEIELMMRTKGYGGFSLLDMHDYPTQGTALIGPLDEFWDSKGFITPQQFKQFCGPVVPLLRMPKRTYTTKEQFYGTIEVAQYGPSDMTGVRPTWYIRDSQGKILSSGILLPKTLPTGTVTQVGAINASLAGFKGPGKFKVTVALPGTQYENSWEIWVYPDANQKAMPAANVVFCESWGDTAKAALAAGKTVFVSSGKLVGSRGRSYDGRLLPVFWSPVWWPYPAQRPCTNGIVCDPKKPAFASFPTEMHSNWQWWDLLNNSSSLIMNDAPAGFRPLVQIVDNFARRDMLGNLFEARVGKGKLLFSCIDLRSDLDKRPAARQLLTSLNNYVSSSKFAPQFELTTDKLDAWLMPRQNKLQAMGAKVIVTDSQAPGYDASYILKEGETDFWHTVWAPTPDPLPHEVIVDMGKPISFQGITCFPRKDGQGGTRIADCEVYCSDDASNWGAPVIKTRLADIFETQQISFGKTITGRYLKLKVLSGHQGEQFISLGELDIILSNSN